MRESRASLDFAVAGPLLEKHSQLSLPLDIKLSGKRHTIWLSDSAVKMCTPSFQMLQYSLVAMWNLKILGLIIKNII